MQGYVFGNECPVDVRARRGKMSKEHSVEHWTSQYDMTERAWFKAVEWLLKKAYKQDWAARRTSQREVPVGAEADLWWTKSLCGNT